MCIVDFNHNTPSEIASLKRRLKRGPRLSRQARAEFALCQIGAAPRRLRPAVAGKIRAELLRLEQSGNPGVHRFCAAMRQRYPEILRVEIEAASL